VKLLTLVAAALGTAGMVWGADSGLLDKIHGLEAAGEARQAHQLLDQALRSTPGDVDVLEAAAHFEDAHRSPLARSLYQRLLDAPGSTGARREAAQRRLVELDLAAGDRSAANAHAAGLRSAGGSVPEIAQASQPVFPMGSIEIPGPMRGFARMAALAPDGPPDELLLALARNVVTNGYQAVSGAESLDQTEYLKLVLRYLSQARELDKFAGDSKTIQIENCESEKTGELLKILGFRLRGACGGDVALETVNASRAFLAMDSGFPIAKLEQSLRTSRPFSHDFKPTRVPVIFSSDYWLSVKEKAAGEFIDAFLNDPSMCRLYLGLAKLDPETAQDVAAYSGFRARFRFLRRNVPDSRRSCNGAGRRPVGRGLGRTGRSRARQRRGVPGKDRNQGRRLDGQLLRFVEPDLRPLAGLSGRTGATEAILCGAARQGDQSRSGAARFSRQHRSDAAHHTPGRR
jgi:hypothetical protein